MKFLRCTNRLDRQITDNIGNLMSENVKVCHLESMNVLQECNTNPDKGFLYLKKPEGGAKGR